MKVNPSDSDHSTTQNIKLFSISRPAVLLAAVLVFLFPSYSNSTPGEKVLTMNKLEPFLIENLMLRTEKFVFTNLGLKLNNPYLVINFNQFRIKDTRPDLPVVTVEGVVVGASYPYYSTKDSGWTFDENIVFLPLLNFEQFVITISWREGGFAKTFQGFIGVFPQNEIKSKVNFIMPGYIPTTLSTSDIMIETTPRDQAFSEGLLNVRLCTGKISSVSLFQDDKMLITTSEIKDLDKGISVPGGIKAGVKYRISIAAESGQGLVFYRATLLGFNSAQSMIKSISDWSPLVNFTDHRFEWNNLGYEAKKQKFAVKSFFNFDTNIDNLLFKRSCGFGKEIIGKDYPAPIGREPQVFSGGWDKSSSFEFSVYTDDDSKESSLMDLAMERLYKSGNENEFSKILEKKYGVVLKEFYYAIENYNNGTYFYLTRSSMPFFPPQIYGSGKGSVFAGHDAMHLTIVTIFILVLAVFSFLLWKWNSEKKEAGTLPLPQDSVIIHTNDEDDHREMQKSSLKGLHTRDSSKIHYKGVD